MIGRHGRRPIIVLMMVAIAMIGFAPTYAAIGVAAPLIIVLARLLRSDFLFAAICRKPTRSLKQAEAPQDAQTSARR